ncbi:MAG: hypothetical protein ABIA63_14350, partial [bacterium]
MNWLRIKSFRIIILVLYALFFLVFNFYAVDIRMNELDYNLDDIANDQGANRSLGMLAKISITRDAIKKDNWSDTRDEYVQETKIYTIMAGEFFKPPVSNYSKYNIFV